MKNTLKKYKQIEAVEDRNTCKDKFDDPEGCNPDFNLGLDYLGFGKTKDIGWDNIELYVEDWFKNPQNFLKLPNNLKVKVEEKEGFLHFPSILDEKMTARFKFDNQKDDISDKKVAMIILMQWGGQLKTYDKLMGMIRRTLLPISTFIHVPAARGLNPRAGDPPDYESVSANIGRTIFRTRQDVLDIQFMAKYLKEEMGYDEVGLLTFSLGSQRGIIASVNYPELFDFAIFNLICDDFTEAVINGMATREVSAKICDNIDYALLQKIWKTISPGAYEDYLHLLPKNTRIVPCKYDFVFGPANEKKLIDKILAKKPDTELELVKLAHTTLGEFPKGYKVMWNNIKYIYKKTGMNKFKRARLFTKKDKNEN